MRAIEILGMVYYGYVIIISIFYFTAWDLTLGNFDELRKNLYPEATDASKE